jgi:spore coat polysaccharide biosynthesis protein SpsF (cytidylyltransferase family)
MSAAIFDIVGLTQRRTLGVDTDEDFRHFINIQRMVQFNDTDLSIGNAFQIIECAVNLIGRNAVIALTVANGEIKWISLH